jgi:hypothetical protein
MGPGRTRVRHGCGGLLRSQQGRVVELGCQRHGLAWPRGGRGIRTCPVTIPTVAATLSCNSPAFLPTPGTSGLVSGPQLTRVGPQQQCTTRHGGQGQVLRGVRPAARLRRQGAAQQYQLHGAQQRGESLAGQ